MAKLAKRQSTFPGRMNRRVVILGIILLVVLALVAIYVFRPQKDQGATERILAGPSIPASWDTYTNKKYNYLFRFPHQPSDAQTLIILSADEAEPDLFKSNYMEVIKAGTQKPVKGYFSVQVFSEKYFDTFASGITMVVEDRNQTLEDKYKKGLVSKEYYLQNIDSVPRRTTFQNHFAFTYENATNKLVFVNADTYVFKFSIDKQDPLGNKIFSTVKLNW
ncbi:MAG: hypothetical protein ACREHC_07535 [Candidatus Levyibacteriota bacterium]